MNDPRRGGRGRSGRASGRESLGGEQVEGRHAVRELLRARSRPVRRLLIAEGLERSGVIDEILELAERSGVAASRVTRARLDAAAATEAPQGVLALAAPLRSAGLADLAAAGPNGERPFLVVLDGVTDPHNLGAVMRTALCAGVTGVVVGRHRAAHLSPAAVKASAGAVEYLPLAMVPGIPAALAELRRTGIWTVGLDAGGDTSVFDLPVSSEALALVLGAEGTGLSLLARRRCEVVARVPMTGPIESLNVAATAAVACFEVARQRYQASGAPTRTN